MRKHVQRSTSNCLIERRGFESTQPNTKASQAMNSATALARLILLLLFAASITNADAAKIWEEISGEKAFAHVQRLVDLGPRPSGSEAIEKSRRYIEDQLRRSGWQVTRQVFTNDTPQGKVQFANLIAQFPGQENAAPLFLLCSHYDTKTFDAIKFVGANDGG